MHDNNAPATTEDVKQFNAHCVAARQAVIAAAMQVISNPNQTPRECVYALRVALTSISDALDSLLTDDEIKDLNDVSVGFSEQDVPLFTNVLTTGAPAALHALVSTRGEDA